MRFVIASFTIISMGFAGSALAVGPEYSGTLNDSPGSIQVAVPGQFGPEITRVTATQNEPFDYENFVLKVDLKEKSSVSMPFYAPYGYFHLSVLGLKPSTSNILLIKGEGKGTSTMEWTLTIYGVGKHMIESLFSTTISSYFDAGIEWWYDVEPVMIDPEAKFQALSLTLRHDPDPNMSASDIAWRIPKDEHICVIWMKNRFREFDGKNCSQALDTGLR
jgi:hypothetical protein